MALNVRRFSSLPSVLLSLGCASCGDEGALVGVIATDGGALVDGARDGARDGDGAGGKDAVVDAADERAFGTFSAPTTIDAIDDPGSSNFDPSMTSDWRELYFISDRTGNWDIWLSRRASAQEAWGAPVTVFELNTPMVEEGPAVSFDGLTLWFSRSVIPGQPQIWVTTRAALGQTWSPPTPVSELNATGTAISAKVDETSLLMFFEWTRSGANQLYASTRPNTQAAWRPPTPIAGLGPAGTAHEPFVASHGLIVWFASTQTGGEDLYSADRASLADSFSNPVPLSELNTPAEETDPALSPDFRYIVFASNRSGTLQLYQSWR